jgi:hypothetical protein
MVVLGLPNSRSATGENIYAIDMPQHALNITPCTRSPRYLDRGEDNDVLPAGQGQGGQLDAERHALAMFPAQGYGSSNARCCTAARSHPIIACTY